MKKYLSLAVCFITSLAYAQNPGNSQKKLAYRVVDELVANYMQYAKINDSASKEALKRLFSKSATIPNEIVPAYYYNNKKEPEKIPDVSINDYLSKLKEVYPQGYGYVKFLNSAISYNGLNQREVSVIFQKNIGAYTFTGLQLEVLDTIQLHILLSPDYKSAVISKIDLLGHAIKFVNDDDTDFVSNEKDKCKTQRGLNSPDGCYTPAETAIAAAAEKKRQDSLTSLRKIQADQAAAAEKRHQDSLLALKKIKAAETAAAALAAERQRDSLAKVKKIQADQAAATERRYQDSLLTLKKIKAAETAIATAAEKKRQDSLTSLRKIQADQAAAAERRHQDSLLTLKKIKAAETAAAEKRHQDSLLALKKIKAAEKASAALVAERQQDSLAKVKKIQADQAAAAAALAAEKRRDSLAKVKKNQADQAAAALAAERQHNSLFYLKQIQALEISVNKLSAETQQVLPRLWGNIGGAVGAVSATLSDNAYKASNFKAIVNPASTFDVAKFAQVNLGLHYFFGSKANIGIGVGLNYNMLNGNAGKDDFHVEYTETDTYGSKFTQLVSSRGAIREKVKIKNLSTPVTLIYKGDFDEKFGYSMEAGILYNLSFKSTASNANRNAFDLEAEYLFDGTAANGGDYADPTVPYNKGSWLITRSQAVAHGATDNGTAYLNEMRSYGFYVGAADTGVSVNNTSNFKSGAVGFIIKPSIYYHFNETTSLSAGFLFTSVIFNQKENNYHLFDKSRTYNTLLNGVNNMTCRNTGFHITFSKTLFYSPGRVKNARAAKMNAELSRYRKKLAQLQAN